MSWSPAARIDLHVHSRYSDGTDEVAELLTRARDIGLDTIALTDHDTVAGWEDAREQAARIGVRVVPGIEVSAEHGSTSVHVLAILPDPSPTTALATQIARARDSRRGRAAQMVHRIGKDYPITWNDVQAQVAGKHTTVGRPHIADALVAAGVVRGRNEAFERILAPSGPYYVPYEAPTPIAAVAAIREAGGVPVLAHPASGAREGELPEALIEELADGGLQALEVDHREHGEGERRRLRQLARALGLLVTGGSDYHGAGKPNRLGENLTRPDVLEAMLSLSSSDTEVFGG